MSIRSIVLVITSLVLIIGFFSWSFGNNKFYFRAEATEFCKSQGYMKYEVESRSKESCKTFSESGTLLKSLEVDFIK